MKLLVNGLTKYLSGLAIAALLLFPPAGTLNYPGGWRLICLLFGPILLLGIILFLKAPELLKKRLDARERIGTQRRVIGLTGLSILLSLPLAALDFRFGWSQLPGWFTAAASVVLVLSYGLFAEVMRENAWLSRTIEVQQGQQVIDSGLYGVVRHPMYAAANLLFLSMPLVLGSVWALIPMLTFPGLMIIRIRSEEKLLLAELPGYAEYTKRVKYRLIPFIW